MNSARALLHTASLLTGMLTPGRPADKLAHNLRSQVLTASERKHLSSYVPERRLSDSLVTSNSRHLFKHPSTATFASSQAAAPLIDTVGSAPHGSTSMRGMDSSTSRVQADVPAPMLIFYADHWVVPLPANHRFPMTKYRATREALAADASLHGAMELREGPQASLDDVALVHDLDYVERFRTNLMMETEMRNVGFPWSSQLVGRTFSSAGGTVEATRHVLRQGGATFAANIAGGTHHAFRDRGEGFCILNDIAIAAAVGCRDFGLDSVLVLDLDVHQGNGTAKIMESEPRVTTFDMHGAGNYPWKTRMQNTYDVALPDGTGDEEYLRVLREWLPRLMTQHKPQLIMFQAGVDALQGDSFGRLSLTRQGLLTRNNLVYSAALQHHVPLVISMGGGYTRPMDRSVECHTDVYRSAVYRARAAAAARAP